MYVCCSSCGRDVFAKAVKPYVDYYCIKCAGHGKSTMPSEQWGRPSLSTSVIGGSAELSPPDSWIADRDELDDDDA